MLPAFSYFRARSTVAGSWSFPGAAGQLSGPSSGRPTSQPQPFSWLTSQRLQPASHTLHLQHRPSPPSRSSHLSVPSAGNSARILTAARLLCPLSPGRQHRHTLPVPWSKRPATWGRWRLFWYARKMSGETNKTQKLHLRCSYSEA